jgi:Tfp pilus assembly protein FimT
LEQRHFGITGEGSVAATAGYSMTQLLVVIAVIGIMALAAPWVLATSRSFTVSRGAREIQAALNQARTVAITTRQNICFQALGGGYALRQGSCVGPAWTGLDTTAAGIFRPSESVTLTGGAALFTPFGTASQTTVITVRAPGAAGLTVTVLPSGRVTIP